MKNNRFFKPFFAAVVLGLLLFLCGCSGSRQAVDEPDKIPIPAVGGQLPAMTLAAPEDASIRAYLGLQNDAGQTISPGEIGGDILLIEIFSMYCPYCQHKAPTVNELYTLIQSDTKLAARIKMIGIGVGNSAFEVGIFRDKYSVAFPLFADSDYKIYKDIGQVRTPFFIAIHNRGEKKNQIFYAKRGGFGDPEDFLQVLPDLAGR
ncbi:MAG TPA: TlpA family protein disulfide reductase [Desulfarculaceae bacterium]|nr:TlpA family protein disulfide reductase [Desulfarculaceae bacterium]